MMLFIPALFEIQEKTGKFLGELSYPIYDVHILAKWMILGVQGVEQGGQNQVSGLLQLVVSLFAAIGIEAMIGNRVEAWRSKRAQIL